MLRILVESIVVFDPILLDFLHNMDHSLKKEISLNLAKKELEQYEKDGKINLILTSPQSYGRPLIKELETKILSNHQNKDSCVILPCSASRPYSNSRKHKRIYAKLREKEIDTNKYDLIVFTSLGVIPSSLWNHLVVMNYNARVPDIYRILCMARKYFRINTYKEVLDCTNYDPYFDVLSILLKENSFEKLTRFEFSSRKHYHLKY